MIAGNLSILAQLALPSTAGTAYTFTTSTVLKTISLCNTDTTNAHYVTINLVASGDTASVKNRLHYVRVKAGDTVYIDPGHFPSNGYTLVMFADTANVIGCTISGVV